MKQVPEMLSLFLCEQVIVEEKTRNVTPVNCFTRRLVDRFPSEPIPFVVFALLTDGMGDVSLEVLIQRLGDTLEELARVVLQSRFTDPLQVVRCTFRVRGFSFPEPGHYQVTLLANNELLAQRTMLVQKKDGSS